MLLVHQAGTVKVGEVIRYTLTYTPTNDRILPSPALLHLKIKNTSAIPLRAAYLHGPYTLHVSAYPNTFKPNEKFQSAQRDGVPEFEPNLKAGGHWVSRLTVPEDIRESGDKVNSKRNLDGSPKTVTWIIEIASQILFSNSASVHFELLVGRDERALEIGFAAVAGKGHGEPGQIKDFQNSSDQDNARRSYLPRGVYSRAVKLDVEDTTALWDKPALPEWKARNSGPSSNSNSLSTSADAGQQSSAPQRTSKPKKLHLVILTHGLHGNVSADMLYLKESIDNAAKQARLHANMRRKRDKRNRKGQKRAGQGEAEAKQGDKLQGPAHVSGGQDQLENDEEGEDDSDDEQVVVRGFTGNSVRTERGIQYLGKRLAKFVLTTTYPDQPFLPASRSMNRSRLGSFSSSSRQSSIYGTPAHTGSSVHMQTSSLGKLPYTFTSISFIGHSLGGLVQMYAIAYIHKHAPEFFKQIKPVNFVAMASPLLGLSNENPLYVKFALDFGLVGRTGQDLGLTWRAPTLVRSGWTAMITGFASGGKDQSKHEDPRSKPLLRILPTGPAHQVLKMFRNRTLYSNVVNDGIVPLRTSCLLFLDWRGLDRVENARRENGLIGTMASFGWAELTGANSSSHKPHSARAQDDDSEDDGGGKKTEVPQPSPNATKEDNQAEGNDSLGRTSSYDGHQNQDSNASNDIATLGSTKGEATSKASSIASNPFSDILSIFRPASPKPQKIPRKTTKAIKRAQTLKPNEGSSPERGSSSERLRDNDKRPAATRGDSLIADPTGVPPPKTSVFTAAGDLLNPPIPPVSWLIDPSSRSRTIFHDRIYHPDDIPPPPPYKRPRLVRSFSSTNSIAASENSSSKEGSMDGSGMKVEEKIARAYHRDLSWRKVLVRLEPDAHNNMVVRRMFANAYGWDVIKHLCDTHFADNSTSLTRDSDETNEERAIPIDEPLKRDGEQVKEKKLSHGDGETCRTFSETREEADEVPDLSTFAAGIESLSSASVPGSGSGRHHSIVSEDSAIWTDEMVDSEDEGEESEDESFNPVTAFQRYWNGEKKEGKEEEQGPDLPPRPSKTQEQEQHKKRVQEQHRQYLKLRMERSSTSNPKNDQDLDSELEIADALTQSPVDVQSDEEGATELDPQPSTAGENGDDSSTGLASRTPGGMTELGLRKPAEAHLAEHSSLSSPGVEGPREEHLIERVARLSGGPNTT